MYSTIMYARKTPEKYNANTTHPRQHMTNVRLHRDESQLLPFKDVEALGISRTTVYDFIKRLKPLFLHAQQVEKLYRETEQISCDTFELLGVDIIFDSDKRPWLLEINNDPAFRSTGIHTAQGPALIEGTLQEVVFNSWPGCSGDGMGARPTTFTEF